MTVHGSEGPARDWVRSYAARRGRRSSLTLDRIERFLPQRQLPDGPLDRLASFGRLAPLVLEVGCGHGVTASLIGARLEPGAGTITGIDRSATMIAAASVRNAGLVADGRATFVTSTFVDAALPDRRFD